MKHVSRNSIPLTNFVRYLISAYETRAFPFITTATFPVEKMFSSLNMCLLIFFYSGGFLFPPLCCCLAVSYFKHFHTMKTNSLQTLGYAWNTMHMSDFSLSLDTFQQINKNSILKLIVCLPLSLFLNGPATMLFAPAARNGRSPSFPFLAIVAMCQLFPNCWINMLQTLTMQHGFLILPEWSTEADWPPFPSSQWGNKKLKYVGFLC